MDKKLYYCKKWSHIFFDDYEMCVSDIIYSNDKKMAQIHLLLMFKDEVIRGLSIENIEKFEQDIRTIVRDEFDWDERSRESKTVKIWYYNEDDSLINPSDIPMRIAVTVVGLNEAKKTDSITFSRKMYSYLKTFVNDI